MRAKRLVPAILVMGALLLGGAVEAKKVKLNVWFPLYGGNLKVGFDQIVKQFEKDNPNIDVEVLGVDVNGEKFLTAMAGGAPPDVIFPDGPQVVQWAYKNLLTPLDKYMTTSKVTPDTFWGPSYKQNLWKGKPYALPWISDSNFAMIHNKAIFNEVGLASSPKNLTELELYTKKINRLDAQGNLTRVGFRVYGGPTGTDPNALFTWTWAFGGDYFDERNGKVMLNSPKVVDALEWMFGFNDRTGGQVKLNKFWEKYTNWSASDGLLTGRVGMGYRLSAFLGDVERAKKSYTDYGYGLVTGPNGDPSAWLGGWCAAIPANARHREESWKFVKWITADNKGATATYQSTGFLPSMRRAKVYETPEAQMKPFVEVMKIADHHRPVTPVNPFLNKELERVMPQVFAGKKLAKQALDEVQTTVQKELDRLLNRRK